MPRPARRWPWNGSPSEHAATGAISRVPWAAWREHSFAFVAEDRHFVDCVPGKGQPLETGEDGRAVLVPRRGIAACESAGEEAD